jgi:hypothetical protein
VEQFIFLKIPNGAFEPVFCKNRFFFEHVLNFVWGYPTELASLTQNHNKMALKSNQLNKKKAKKSMLSTSKVERTQKFPPGRKKQQNTS